MGNKGFSKKSKKKSPKLRSSGGKKQNSSSSAFGGRENLPRGRYVMGIHSAKEVIKVRPGAVDHVFLKSDFESNSDLVAVSEWANKLKIPVESRPLPFFNKLCQTHQGLCLVVSERPKFNYEELKKDEKQVVLVLDGLEDPHNLGAILRTAWLMGVKALFVPKQKASPLTPTAIKVASGAAEHIPILEESNLPQMIEQLKEIGFWSYGLSHKAEQSLWSVDLPSKVVWVIGSEGKGMRIPVERATDVLISIPQKDKNASYNASVATAMALSETLRQQSLSL